jgi:hypothetical protein
MKAETPHLKTVRPSPYRGASRSIQQSGEPGNVRIVLQKSLLYVPSFPEIGAAKVKLFPLTDLKNSPYR